jgi:uncharacterized Zn-binding protein involved in type VI secretion
MPKGPAARLGDPTMHGTPLAPGPGSPNVMIGMKPAWRGVPAAAAQVLQAAKKASDKVLGVLAQATVTAAAAVPPVALPAAQAAEVAGRAAALGALTGAINGAAAAPPADKHMCAMPFAAAPPDMAPSPCPPGPPHGPGVVIDGSQTVQINFLPACRQGDHVLEALGPLDPIAMGEPTVIIGD